MDDSGYAIVERVFDRQELEGVSDAIDASAVPRSKAGSRNVLRVPAVSALATHRDLMQLARTFLGPAAIPFRATLFDKSATSNWLVAWHQDTALPIRRRVDDPSWGAWTTKAGVLHAIAPASALATVVALRVHLDDSSWTNGPLRVLPDTHKLGVLRRDEIARLAKSVPGVECVCPIGGVVAMRPLVVHASSKSRDGTRRRVVHIEFTASIHFAGIELAVG